MKKVKRILAFLLIGILAFSMAGCSSPKKQAEQAVTKMFDALKEGNIEEAQNYIDLGDAASFLGEDSQVDAEKILVSFFGRMEYKILSVEEKDENTVAVKVELTTVDMEVALQNVMMEVFSYALSNPEASEEEVTAKVEEIMVNAITAEDAEMMTKETTATVMKGEDGWKVEGSEEFLNDLLGGFPEAAEGMSSAFGG